MVVTRFTKDRKAAKIDAIGVLMVRDKEMDELERKGRAEKNAFRRQCIAQELARLRWEYEQIESWFVTG